MANHGEPDLTNWVDERLGALTPPAAWREGDPTAGWARLERTRKQREQRVRERRVAGMAIASAAVGAAWWLTREGTNEVVLAELRPERERPLAPDFSLPGLTGPVELRQFRGRVALVDFWATWCPPCKQEMPWFAEFQRKYESAGLTVIGIAMEEGGWTPVRPFAEKAGIQYPMALGNDDVARRYGVTSLPTTLVVDRSGRIAARHEGLVSRAAVESEIRHLLTRTDSK